MDDSSLMILMVIAIVIIILVIRYVVGTVIHRGADAVENAYKKSKNKNNPTQSQNLSDRYKNDSSK